MENSPQMIAAALAHIAFFAAMAGLLIHGITTAIRDHMAARRQRAIWEAGRDERARRWAQAGAHWRAMRAAQAAGDAETVEREYQSYRRLAY